MNTAFLSKTLLFQGIREHEIEAMLKCLGAHEKEYKKGQTIYQAGQTVKDLGLVLSGGVNIVVYDYWGNSTIFSHIAPGQIFAETYSAMGQEELLVNVIADQDSHILFVDTYKLMTTCQHACPYHQQAIHNLIRISAQKNLNLSKRMLHTASKSIRGRLVSYLSEQALQHGTNRFHIPFSRQQLADYLGVDRSALSNELSKMQKDGLLQYHKNEFILTSWDEKNLA